MCARCHLGISVQFSGPNPTPTSLPQGGLYQLLPMPPQHSLCVPLCLTRLCFSYLPGVFRGGHDILVRSRLLLLDTVTMQVTARSSEELPVDIILASVG